MNSPGTLHFIFYSSEYKTFSRLCVDKSVICNQLQSFMPSSHFPMSTRKWKGRWNVSKSFKFCLCKLQPLGLLTFLKPNSTRDLTNYSLHVMRRGNATWICPALQMSVTEPQMMLNNPLEAVTNICEPEQWLPNEDSKSLDIHSWRCLGKLLALEVKRL